MRGIACLIYFKLRCLMACHACTMRLNIRIFSHLRPHAFTVEVHARHAPVKVRK